jgi:hypothetical protein
MPPPSAESSIKSSKRPACFPSASFSFSFGLLFDPQVSGDAPPNRRLIIKEVHCGISQNAHVFVLILFFHLLLYLHSISSLEFFLSEFCGYIIII